MSDPEQRLDETTPTSPSPAPAKAHGDAFADESGSRQGENAPEEEERPGAAEGGRDEAGGAA